MNNVNFIVKMRNYSLRFGADGTARGFMRKWQENLHKRQGIAVTVKGLDAQPKGAAVRAYIHQGQWIADCECGGHEFVDPQDAVFFCWGCVNRENNSYIRPVMFPENWEAIEQAVLARPVHDLRGSTDLERAGLAQPVVVVKTADGVYPLVRSWAADETLDELLEQNAVLAQVAGQIENVRAGEVIIVEVGDGI